MDSPEKKEWYFAHAVNMYNEPIEAAFIEFIAHRLTNGDKSAIENPNQPHHQEGYKAYTKRMKESDTQHKGINYFYDKVLPNCHASVAVPFLDGRLGLGVVGESKWFLERGRPALFVYPLRLASPEELEQFIKNPAKSDLNDLFDIRSFSEKQVDRLYNVDPKTGNALVCSREETRLRTWVVYNRVKRPYAEAHLARLPLPEGFYPEG